MSVRTFALAWGILFLLIGIVGFIPGLTTPHTSPGVTMPLYGDAVLLHIVVAGGGAYYGFFHRERKADR